MISLRMRLARLLSTFFKFFMSRFFSGDIDVGVVVVVGLQPALPYNKITMNSDLVTILNKLISCDDDWKFSSFLRFVNFVFPSIKMDINWRCCFSIMFFFIVHGYSASLESVIHFRS